MEFQHFLHHHKLSSVEFEENNMPLCLPGCMDIVAGPAYCCRECACTVSLSLISNGAMSIFFNDENEIAKHDEEAHQWTTIRHFCHPHQLNRCVFSSRMIPSEMCTFE
ncbi:hypothetical protein V6N12_023954 [Hibiscus sabdariffa]|uniref:Uncharacterized protein n=1 Tax=Hibiscus sabdariffa TaxID=183260 RepID=A0ABR2FZ68_9ROSI